MPDKSPARWINTHDDIASLKPFRLVKFFSFTALAMILASTLVLSWVISNDAKDVLLKRSEAYIFLLAENLNNQVLQQFVLPTVVEYGEIALSNPKQFKKLDTIIRNITHGFKVDSVTIFDSTENIISYSTIAERVGKVNLGGKEYELAKSGKKSTILESSGSLLNLLPGAKPISSKLKAYIPFIPVTPLREKSGPIIGVTEIVQDLSDDLEAIIRLQGTIMSTSILIMAILFAVLRMIVSRADQIIEARAEERRKLEVKLHQAERLASLGKMVAAVSHEIKNPLGIVRSTAEILGKRLKSVAPGNEHLAEIIIAETTRLDGVVMEFLDFARPQTPRLKDSSLNEVLANIVEFIEPELIKQQIKLETALDHHLPDQKIDPNLLYRCFLNILINAMQAMPDGGLLSLSTGRQSAKGPVFVRITDTGIGMSKAKIDRIFNPFFTDKNRGTGLGLAIAKNIIDSHNGEINVISKKDKGTTFTITLGGS